MKSIVASSLSILALGISAQAAAYTVSGPIDPIQATTNPTNAGTGSGSIAGDYDDVTNLLNYTISWSGLDSGVTAVHFHNGAPGQTGGVQVGVGTAPNPNSGSATLSEAQEAELLANGWYLNIHTNDFGGGEIRGQALVAPVPEPSAALLGVLALSGIALRRRR